MLVIKEFTSQWCGVCKSMRPLIQKIVREHGDSIQFEEIDITNDPEIAKTYNVSHLPTFIFEVDGKEIKRTSGAVNPVEFKNTINANK